MSVSKTSVANVSQRGFRDRATREFCTETGIWRWRRAARVIRKFHHIIEEAFRLIAAHLEDVHERFVASRDGFESLDAAEFALVGAGTGERAATNGFDGAIRSQNVPGKPHLPVTASANAAQDFVVRNNRW